MRPVVYHESMWGVTRRELHCQRHGIVWALESRLSCWLWLWPLRTLLGLQVIARPDLGPAYSFSSKLIG